MLNQGRGVGKRDSVGWNKKPALKVCQILVGKGQLEEAEEHLNMGTVGGRLWGGAENRE